MSSTWTIVWLSDGRILNINKIIVLAIEVTIIRKPLLPYLIANITPRAFDVPSIIGVLNIMLPVEITLNPNLFCKIEGKSANTSK